MGPAFCSIPLAKEGDEGLAALYVTCAANRAMRILTVIVFKKSGMSLNKLFTYV